MKKILLLLLLTASLCQAQISTSTVRIQTDGRTPFLSMPDPFTGEFVEFKPSITGNTATFAIPLMYPYEVLLEVEKVHYRLLVVPNDILDIHIKQNKLFLKGRMAAVNNTIVQYLRGFYGPDLYARGRELNQYIPGSSADSAKTFLHNRFTRENKALETFISQNNTDSLFNQWARQRLLYEYGEQLLRYASLQPTAMPNSYFNFLRQFPVNNTAASISAEYAGYLDEYHQYSLRKVVEENAGLAWYNSLPPGLGRDLLVTRYINELLEAQLVSFVTKDKKQLHQLIGNTVADSVIFARYDQQVKERANSSTSLAGHINVTPADTSLQAFIAPFRGKVIYIDIWGTWCAPCREQMPAAHTLHEALKKEDVVFLYLCVQSDPGSWKPMINKLNIQGEHYLLTDEQYHQLKAAYTVNAVPRYMIIGKQGNMVSKNAPAPSDGGLEEFLRTLSKAN